MLVVFVLEVAPCCLCVINTTIDLPLYSVQIVVLFSSVDSSASFFLVCLLLLSLLLFFSVAIPFGRLWLIAFWCCFQFRRRKNVV